MYYWEISSKNAVIITDKPSWLVFKRFQFRFLVGIPVFLTVFSYLSSGVLGKPFENVYLTYTASIIIQY